MQAVESLPAMVWIARPDMSCEYLSPQWLSFTGHTLEQALGEGWAGGVHPEDLARWLDTAMRAFDAREPYEIEYRLRSSDGAYRWVLDRGAPRYGAGGSFLGFVGACVDIDRRKRAEHGMARSLERERKLRIATEAASRVKDDFLASVLADLQSPVRAIATWAAHLRAQGAAASGPALDAIEHNARAQDRIISSLLELSRVAAGQPARERGSNGAPLLTGVRVLIVDDDPAARQSMTQVLDIAGAQTKSAASSSEALDALGVFHPDVLLSDVHMHGGEGYFLIRALRALPAERGGCLRAAALTTRGEPDDGIRAGAAGYDAQLAKPVEPVMLLATVARLAQPAGV